MGDLVDLNCSFAQRIAEAVGAGVAAAEDRYALALGRDLRTFDGKSRDATILLCQVRHCELDTSKLATREDEVAVALRTRGEDDGIDAVAEFFKRKVATNVDAGGELDSFGLQLLEAAIDQLLLELEVGDAVAQESAKLVGALEDGHAVAFADELLGAGKASRARTNDGDPFAG